jgi:hypothetical protein
LLAESQPTPEAEAVSCASLIMVEGMMKAGCRAPALTGARPDWMEPFARTINAKKKYVVSGTLERINWNAEFVREDVR